MMMLNDRLKALNTVVPALFASESELDAALQGALNLAGSLLRARGEAKLAATVGSEAIHEAGLALTSLFQARQHQVALHERLAELKEQIGLRHIALGGGEKPDGMPRPSPQLQAA